MNTWTPDQIADLFERLNHHRRGSRALLMKIMRVTRSTATHLCRPGSDGEPIKKPSKGAGISLLNLLDILTEELGPAHLDRVLQRLAEKNASHP